MGLLGYDANSSSATQNTQGASGTGQIVSGNAAQITNPGSIAVGKGGRYEEGGALDLSNSKNAVLGSSYNLSGTKGNSTLNIQNLDPQVVQDALNLVKDTQQQANDQSAQNAAALKATNDNLTALLGTTPPDATATTTGSSTLVKVLKWLGAGVVAVVILYWLFHKK
jgi:repressor of nif and glnA expression